MQLPKRALRKALNSVFKKHISIWYIKHLNCQSISVDASRLPLINGLSVYFDRLPDIINWLTSNKSTYPWIFSKKEIESMEKYEHIVPFVEYNNQIIAYVKIALNRIYLKDYDSYFTLATNKAMSYDTTVINEYRGKKIPYFLKEKIFKYLYKNGINEMYSLIEPWNIPSIKSNKGLGFSEIGKNRYMRLFGYHRHSLDIKRLLG